MRGTHAADGVLKVVEGIIPAYAGNTKWCGDYLNKRGDHPRVYGEHLSTAADIDMRLGSSPRMRGTPLVADPVGGRDGIIPAYAGNTAPTASRC